MGGWKNSGPLLHKVSALEPIWPAETLISIFSHCLHTLCLPKLKCRDMYDKCDKVQNCCLSFSPLPDGASRSPWWLTLKAGGAQDRQLAM